MWVKANYSERQAAYQDERKTEVWMAMAVCNLWFL